MLLNGVEVKHLVRCSLCVFVILGVAAPFVDNLRSMNLLEHIVGVMKKLNNMWFVVFGVGSWSIMCGLHMLVSFGVGKSRFTNQYEGVLGFSEWKWMCQDPRMK